MSSIKLLDKDIKQIEQIIRNFYGGKIIINAKIHLMSWNKLASLIAYGGLGLRHMKLFNSNLLVK